MNKEIDHKYTDEIVCPYCGYTFNDSWELCDPDHDQEVTCSSSECGEDFILYTNMEITYTTRKMNT